ncbi:tyrosine-type recombinase/integrase [Klebsiella oxytoca]|uniref:tyrosine-type recombinase/integrase n=1 Tax=Klebsiella oxytoca TaxID=571 RepID=UPI000DFB3D11|nr:tyrosine-type recombinase/integrase [Klebsiella oxytoca]STR23064.1 phage integrase [Klebsiella oxytoca]
MAILTDTKARHIKPGDKALPHGGVIGLTLNPTRATKGRGYWIFRYVSPVTQKRRQASIGTYPEISIAEVGKIASAMREQLAKNVDPLEEKSIQQQNEKQKASIPTFQSAAEKLHPTLLPGWKNVKHGKQWITTLQTHAFPILGVKTLDTINAADIAETLFPIWLSHPATAKRVKQRIYTVMEWGLAQGYCKINPVDVVAHLLPQQNKLLTRAKHFPAMPWKTIPLFFANHLHSDNAYDVSRALLAIVILTACRSGEVRAMRWCEINEKQQIWTIPPEKMKGGIQHRVPLTNQAMEIIRKMKGTHKDLVFPSVRKQTVLSDMALTSFLRRVEAPSDIPDRVATAHGFRSSFRDWCSEHGYSRDLAERALAHAIQSKVEAAYHRTDLLEQRRPMMQAWADYVTRSGD